MVEEDIAEGREDPSLMQPPPNGRVNGKAFSYIVRHKCTPGGVRPAPEQWVAIVSESPPSRIQQCSYSYTVLMAVNCVLTTLSAAQKVLSARGWAAHISLSSRARPLSCLLAV
eukprot:jgi/Botrbrau1/13812/Bobra.0056s0057.1